MGDKDRAAGGVAQEPGRVGVPADGLQDEVLARSTAAADLAPRALGLHRAEAGGDVQVLDVHVAWAVSVDSTIMRAPARGRSAQKGPRSVSRTTTPSAAPAAD